MSGHLQEGFGCVVTNRSDQLFDDESDPFEVLKAAENKKKEAGGGGVGGPGAKSAAQAAAQTNSNAAGKQLRKESQKERKNPLPPNVGVVDKKEETQPPVALKKEGKAVVEGGGDPGWREGTRVLTATTGFWGSEGPRETWSPISPRFPRLTKARSCEGAGSVVAPSSNRHLQGSWSHPFPPQVLSGGAWSGSWEAVVFPPDSLAGERMGRGSGKGAPSRSVMLLTGWRGLRGFFLLRALSARRSEVRLCLLGSCPAVLSQGGVGYPREKLGVGVSTYAPPLRSSLSDVVE